MDPEGLLGVSGAPEGITRLLHEVTCVGVIRVVLQKLQVTVSGEGKTLLGEKLVGGNVAVFGSEAVFSLFSQFGRW